ncbi:hypothetical protein SAMN05444920_11088 [Nonomuraea solani]|uniref:C2H2-type domain-containing protein n=1 Tax=Nonomuraea solani TaxID=1144553 RepID=A0A1H6EHQ2_9ACTN|nr:hypothetical protein [Nonomuraea solani]SEG96771.1 hypothetical protein SAMN05444920_11088 [Nonomuraea solani]
MRDGFETRESWPFECLRCLFVWEADYVVRHLTDDHGNEVEIWLSSGVTVQPPWSGTDCPACGAYHTTSFPAGYLTRHPELMAPPEPVALADVPVQPVKEISVPLERAAPPRRLLIAVGVPVVLFVGYELYENLLGPTLHH